jgi:DNA-binding LacI/PurR family transcriptional regulator
MVDGLSQKVDYVSVDNLRGAQQATEHLIRLGHLPHRADQWQFAEFPARLRQQGFVKALNESGRPVDPTLWVADKSNRRENGFTEETGYAAMLRLLNLGKNRRRLSSPPMMCWRSAPCMRLRKKVCAFLMIWPWSVSTISNSPNSSV